MANVTNQNPFIIDTADTALIFDGLFQPAEVFHLLDSNVGDRVIVKDRNDDIVLEYVSRGDSAEEILVERCILPWDGMKVTALGVGNRLFMGYK